MDFLFGLELLALIVGGIVGPVGMLFLGFRRPKTHEDKSSRFPASELFGFREPRDIGDDAAKLARLRQLEAKIEDHTEGTSFPYDGIWDLHFELGALGIAWPGPGVSTELRRAVSKKILAASRDLSKCHTCIGDPFRVDGRHAGWSPPFRFADA